jgi:hypothetical protein
MRWAAVVDVVFEVLYMGPQCEQALWAYGQSVAAVDRRSGGLVVLDGDGGWPIDACGEKDARQDYSFQ